MVHQRRVIGWGFLAAAGGLLVAVPAVLKAAGVDDWRLLTGVAVLAPVAALVSGVWQDRFKAVLQRRDTLTAELATGTFTPGGKLPRVRDITSPITLGVHPAPGREAHHHDDAGGGRAGDPVPVYVPRDMDGELRAALEVAGFVLLVGDSTAGKSRAAFEAVRAVLPDHVLVMPEGRDGVVAAVQQAAVLRRCVVWLNDLERYLGTGGLSGRQVSELLAGTRHHRVVVATLRAAEEERLTAGGDEAGRGLQQDAQAVLDHAQRIVVERRFSEGEQQRARQVAARIRESSTRWHTPTCTVTAVHLPLPRRTRQPHRHDHLADRDLRLTRHRDLDQIDPTQLVRRRQTHLIHGAALTVHLDLSGLLADELGAWRGDADEGELADVYRDVAHASFCCPSP